VHFFSHKPQPLRMILAQVFLSITGRAGTACGNGM
jgi:hypothetical protein